jgi:NAD(P)H-flavin reductase
VPQNYFSQAHATTRTIFREIAYPQGFYITKPRLSWLSPPSVGRCLVILVYCITITVMLTTNSISNILDPYYFERIGYRAAWVSAAQVPLIVLLAGKLNIIGLLVGSSYERLNWLHRWVSRVLIVSVAVHAGFFLRQWIRADFLQVQLQMMPVVKYGMGAGGVLLWMNLSGLAPLRHSWYEFFVIQHLASMAVFLWCLHRHIPAYAIHWVWMSIAFVAFDRVARFVWVLIRNIKLRNPDSTTPLRLADRIGYRTELHALPGDTTRVIIKNVPFHWSPGQHIFLWIPRIGFIETHPFTISNVATSLSSASSTPHTAMTMASSGVNAQLEIRAHSGFSRRLHNLATRSPDLQVRSFIQGPFGKHPDWQTFETLLLISASTGASFTLPILESVLADPCCVRTVHFILLIRSRPQCSCYLHRLRAAARAHGHSNLTVSVHVAVTGDAGADDEKFEGDVQGRCCCGDGSREGGCVCGSDRAATKRFSTVSSSDDTGAQTGSCCAGPTEPDEAAAAAVASCCAGPPETYEPAVASCCAGPTEEDDEPAAAASCCAPQTGIPTSTVFLPDMKDEGIVSSVKPVSLTGSEDSKPPILTRTVTRDVQFVARRPMLSGTIRSAVEEARGETCVVVCGGKALSGHVRNVVAGLSDERAVHKGSGAQGIALWVEEFGF